MKALMLNEDSEISPHLEGLWKWEKRNMGELTVFKMFLGFKFLCCKVCISGIIVSGVAACMNNVKGPTSKMFNMYLFEF